MKKKQKKILTALLATLVLVVTACAVIFMKTYDLSLKATEFTVENQNGSVLIQWEKDENAKGYYICRTDGGESKKIAEIIGEYAYNDKTVVSGTEYTYSVSAFTDSGRSFDKNEKNCVYLDTPVVLGGGSTHDGISMTWAQVEGSEGYNIYRKEHGTQEWSLLAQVSADAVNYCDSTVAQMVTYVYTVSARKANSESGRDEKGLHAQFIAAPQNLKVTNTVTGVEISWSSVGLIDGYQVFRQSGNSEEWELIETIEDRDKTNYFDENVSNGTMYQYKINTYYGSVVSDYNSQSEKTVYISPTVVSKVLLKENGFNVQWIQGSGVEGYVLFRMAEGEEFWFPVAVIDKAETTEYTDTTVKSGVKYSYTVSQCIGEYNSAYITQAEKKLFISAPELSVKNSPSGVKLTWTKSEGAEEYRIYRKSTEDKKWERIAKVEGADTVSYIDDEAPYGAKTRYKISACAEKEKSRIRSAVSLYPVDPHKPMVALTYDDGPYAPATNSIINTLKKHNARATFFIVGSRVKEFEDCIKSADKIGCEIANHTYEHTILTSVKKKKIKSEISKTNKAVEKVIGKSPVLVRAPGGSVDDKVKKYVNYPLVNWSVDTLDWKYRNASSVISKVKAQVEDGSIVLMHDLYMSTAEASKTIVPWLIKQGYQLVTVSEMMETKGIEMTKGNLYTSAEKED